MANIYVSSNLTYTSNVADYFATSNANLKANVITIEVANVTPQGNILTATSLIDYSPFFAKAIGVLENIHRTQTNVETKIGLIEGHLSNIKSNAYVISTTLDKLQGNVSNININFATTTFLANGEGIHTITPWEWLSAASLYDYYGISWDANNSSNVNSSAIASLIALKANVESQLSPYFDPDTSN